MDKPEAEDFVDLPEEPHELLELLQDTINTFREHLTHSLHNDCQKTLPRKHLKS